jgi:hypothetical protein
VFPNFNDGSTYDQLGYLAVLSTGVVAFNGTVPASVSLASIQFRTP